MRLRSERYVATFLDPRRGFAPARVPAEVRWDPLTGRSCRLLPEGTIPRPAAHDLRELDARTRPGCPFCGEALARETPRLPPELHAEGRIRCGEAVLFPNLVPYAPWSSVSVYSPDRHLLPLAAITPRLLADNLRTQAEFARTVLGHDPAASWISVNANHLPPSGSSIFHPHLQGTAAPWPTTAQRELADVPAATLREYVDAERGGERSLGSSDGVDWVAAWAPAGIGEVRAFALDAGSVAELTPELLEALAAGAVRVLRAYAELGFESFNLALTGRPLVLRLAARAYFGDAGRSDVMWLERLHGDVATDLHPERLAERVQAALTDF